MVENNKHTDVERFARILIAATANEPKGARLALAFVVYNRRETARRFFKAQSRPHPQFGDGSLAEACHSVMRDAGPLESTNGVSASASADPDYYRALAVVCLVLCGEQADPTQGAVEFHRHDELPDWASRRVPSALIGSWLFYPPA